MSSTGIFRRRFVRTGCWRRGSSSGAYLVLLFLAVTSMLSRKTLALVTRQRTALSFLFSHSNSMRSKALSFSPPSTPRTQPQVRAFTIIKANIDDDEQMPVKKKKTGASKKYRLKEGDPEAQAEKLARAFDELAKKEGFDSGTALFADDESFEDDFDDDDYFDFGDDSLEMDPESFEIRDFVDTEDDPRLDGPSSVDDMDARIAAAQNDAISGTFSVPDELHQLASDITASELSKLGFKRELNPFGDDETPRKEQFSLVTNSMTCSACGVGFQCQDEQRPGYIPPEKFSLQVKLKKIEEVQSLQEKAASEDSWTPEDEVEWLIQQADGKHANAVKGITDVDIDAMAEEMGLDLLECSKKKVICKRCHGLQNFGKVEDALRPGWTNEPLLSQQQFRDLLRPIREKPAVIIALIDLFDFAGSVLPELDNIAGPNPVILAANKADLLPSTMGKVRVESWVRRELEFMGVKSLANVGGAVRLVSCKTGAGVASMLEKARSIAEEKDGDIYVVGAANAGKSTLMNFVLNKSTDKEEFMGKRRAGNANARKGAITTSPLPGTTLKFIKVDLGDGRNLYDTPGLLVPGTITQKLTPEELKMVVPKKQVEAVTFRLAPGKCILIGGLARIDLHKECKPFLFTVFVSNDIKLHLTDVAKANDYVQNHVGKTLTPPLEPGEERLQELGESEEHILTIDGSGWKEAAADISLTGLGWVAVTGAGQARIRISVPKGIGVAVRPPLMPFDIWEATAKYTGSRAVRKISKSSRGKKRRGVGRR